jgi:hypothetical protein
MKKVERQPDHNPAEPYAGGREAERKSEHDPVKGKKSEEPRRPEDPAGQPAGRPAEPTPRYGGKEHVEDERSDRASSGRPLQLDEPEGGTPPGRDRAPSKGEPMKR